MNQAAEVTTPEFATPTDIAPDWGVHWSNRFHTLGAGFFTELPAQGIANPHWVATSTECARLLGWPDDWSHRSIDGASALDVFSGNAKWQGMQPLASVYSGHQFGVWAGQLGDGRALLVGEAQAPGGTFEIQLKGSGLTPYSRMGDGRAVLRSSIREFLCSEAMHALRIPTTRALCITGSAQPVRRETVETAAIVTRVAESFIRFGHFEHFAHHDQHARLKQLADFVIENYFPECANAVSGNASQSASESVTDSAAVDAPRYLALLREVSIRTADLMAQWQSVGFCHGVMNTDNMSILGLTIDYGPFGFLDGFDPGHICNHSDHQGRYAWARQPNVAFWNLHALAQALLPLIGDGDLALDALEVFKTRFADSMLARWQAKLGLTTSEEGDRDLIDDLLRRMASGRCDFTILFRRLCSFDSTQGAVNAELRDMFLDREGFDTWAQRYASRLAREGSVDAERALQMKRINPKFVLRNHLAETAIQEAKEGRFDEIERLLKALRAPFDESPDGITPAQAAAYAAFPPDWAQEIEVSCSS